MDVAIDHGAGYGDTLTWTERDKPKLEVRQIEERKGAIATNLFLIYSGTHTVRLLPPES